MAESTQHIVTARKWRPLQFKDVVGQEHITRTLKNSIKTGRIHHAALFTGSRGVGKTTTARIFARALNCPNAPERDFEPCNECESCTSILSGSSLNVLEIDGASNNSVDDIRSLRENAKYAPSNKGYKVYIIDEVHMLSTAAFNALLKLLEEPPEHLIFIFATTEPQKILPTIISRTQRYDFRRMEIEETVGQLSMIAEKEEVSIDEKSLITIAKKGDGSMRDSQSIFDQVIAFCGKEVDFAEMKDALHLIDEELFFEIEESIWNTDQKSLLSIVDTIRDKGYDLIETLHGLVEHYRNLFSISITGNTDSIVSDAQTKSRYGERAKTYTKQYLLSVISKLTETELEIKKSSLQQVRFEMAMLSLASIKDFFDLDSFTSENPAQSSTLSSEKKKPKPEALNRSESAPRAVPPLQKENLTPHKESEKELPKPANPFTFKQKESATDKSQPENEPVSNANYESVSSPPHNESVSNQTQDNLPDNKQETSTSGVTDESDIALLDRKMKELFNAKKIN